jgi:tRNA(Ile)-lysidine synthase
MGREKMSPLSTPSELESGLIDFFSKKPYIEPGSCLLALSGGVDSTVLLIALTKIGKKPLRAIYVNHNLRDSAELENEIKILVNNCRSCHVPLTIATIPRNEIENLGKKKKIGIEAAAREMRYGVFRHEVKRWRASGILTAHNQNDVSETLLVRMLSSSSSEGLCGIEDERLIGKDIYLLRPLLFATRKRIEEYVSQNNLAVSIDSSNIKSDFLRNKIRHLIVPILDDTFHGWETGLLGTSRKLRSDWLIIKGLLHEKVSEVVKEQACGKVTIDWNRFLKLGSWMRIKIMTLIVGKLSGKKRIAGRAIETLCENLISGTERCQLYSINIQRKDGELIIGPKLDFIREHGYFFLIPTFGAYESGRVFVSIRKDEKGKDSLEPDDPSGSVIHIFEDSFSFPVVVRNRIAGDFIKTEQGTMYIDDILKNWNLEERDRKKVTVIEDSDGILAILTGSAKGSDKASVRFRRFSGSRKDPTITLCIKRSMNSNA